MKLATSTAINRRQGIDVLMVNNAFASAEISLLGAHVLSYKPKSDNIERLWLSDAAKLDGRHPIRGGVPICWPWFSNSHGQSDESLPSHGYVRTQIWRLTECLDTQTGTQLTLEPASTEGAGFSGNARLKLKLLIGEQLSIQLISENIGAKAFTISTALHSYLAIGDIAKTQLSGLSGSYLDKTRQGKAFSTPAPYKFNQETDRIHLCTAEKLAITHTMGKTQVKSAGHDSWVIWNPWRENSIRMTDMTNEGYSKMLCVETAVTQGLSLAPNEQHILQQIIY